MRALIVVGAPLGVLYLPVATTITLGVYAAIIGPLVGVGICTHTRGREVGGPPLPYLLFAGAVAALGVLAVCGFLALFGAAALLGLGLLTVCSPAALRVLLARPPQHARSGPHTVAAPGPAPVQPSPPSCHTLSDAELCWQWRTSFAALQHTQSLAERLYLIETRSALLDELAARDPDGLTRWLNSGARAASDPARYFTGAHQQPPHQQPPHRPPATQ